MMKTHTLIVALIGLWIGGGVSLAGADDTEKQDTIKKELKKLEGTWVLVALERNGIETPEEEVKHANFRLIIKGGKMTFKRADSAIEGTIVVDPSKKPPAYD